MSPTKAKFYYRGYEVEWSLINSKAKVTFSDRLYKQWLVVVVKDREPIHRTELYLFVPSSYWSQRLIKQYCKPLLTKQRKKQLLKYLRLS